MSKAIRWLAPLTLLLLWAQPGMAQVYGTGEVAYIPQVDPSAITIDGVRSDDEPWNEGALINLTQNWSGGWNNGFGPTPDVVAEARVLYAQDTLYVWALFEDYELYFSDIWNSDQIIIGVDPVRDPAYQEEGGWTGWAHHRPDSIHAFRVGDQGMISVFSTDAGDSLVSLEGEDWHNSVPFVVNVDTLQQVGIEAAIYVPGLQAGSEIGFNIGGSAATVELEGAEEGAAYAWFSWQANANPGGDILFDPNAYGTLIAVEPGVDVYGTGRGIEVPRVSPSAITIDGVRSDDEPWNEGALINLTQNWSGGWNNGFGPTPDVVAEARVLYAQDTLYVWALFEDYELYFSDIWNSDQIIIGVDPVRDPAYQEEGGWTGWAHHRPDSIHAFRVGDQGMISVFSTDAGDSLVSLEGEDWHNSVPFVVNVDTLQQVGIEAAIYVPGLQAGSEIGFNIGGSAATVELEGAEEGAAYAWFSWQANANPGGDILFDPNAYGTIIASDYEIRTGIEEDRTSDLPEAFALRQNYPNPFNPTTTIEYQLMQSGRVRLDIFDILGRRVATLVDGDRLVGTHVIRWDASGLASGVYLYQLSVDGAAVATRKMMLLK